MSGARIVLSGIPTKTYYDPAIFVEETERIFRRHWGFACLTTEVTRPGAYLTANIGGDNVIVVRDENQLRAFHNVCLHRGAEIVSGVGTATEFKCPYHTWTYGLDGSLVRVPGVKKFPNAIGLRPLRLETWGPFVFVCSDPDIAPLAYFFGDLFDYFQDKVDLVEIVSNGTMEEFNFEIEANWKVVVENSLECYHCAYAHPGLASSIDLRKFEQWVEGWWSAQQAPQRIEGKNRGVALGEVTQASAKESGMNTARFNFLFPNMYISVWPGSHGFSTTEISTKGCHRTRTRHRRFFQNNVSQAEREESHAFISEVINEDIALCESVQRGLDRDVTDQRLMINQGRLGADETCILHFHELLQHKRERPTLDSVRETNF